jgi:hypothetical protein
MVDAPASPPPGEPPETPPGPAPSADPPGQPDPLEPQDGDGDTVASLRREAAGYRTRLRDTEAERDDLRQRVDRMERSEVLRLAGAAGFSQPDDVLMFATDLDQLRSDTGELDTGRVTDLAQRVLSERPGLRRPGVDVYGGGSRLANGRAREPGLYDLVLQHQTSRPGTTKGGDR